MDLVTITGVPILRTGHYDLQSGPVDFSTEHLHAAVAAFENDPAVLAPRIRVELEDQGHLDDGGIAVEAAGGSGGPALGWADGLRVDGNTLYADLHVPGELADVIEWAYPSRSIEGLFGFTTATGQTHDFVATGLLLLGTSWPGVSTLPDLRELESDFAAEVATANVATYATAAAPDDAHVVAARPAPRIDAQARAQLVQAGLNVADLRMRWYGAESDGELTDLPESYDYWSWYVTEIRADDDGTLYAVVVDEATGEQWRFDVGAISGSDVQWSPPRAGALDWIDAPSSAAARSGRPSLALGSWTSRGASRTTATATGQEGDSPMTDEQRRALAASYGLAEDATEEQIMAAAQAQSEARAAAGDGEPGSGEGEPGSGDEGDGGSGEPAPEPEAAVAADGRTVNISREVWEQTQRDARDGAAARAAQVASERDELVRAAMRDGRITPAEAGLQRNPDGSLPDGWRRDLDAAPEVTARRLEALEPGKYPGGEPPVGAAGENGGRDGGYGRVLASFGVPSREVK